MPDRPAADDLSRGTDTAPGPADGSAVAKDAHDRFGYRPLATQVMGLKHLPRLERTTLLRRRLGRVAFVVIVILLPITLAVLVLRTLPDDPAELVLSEPDLPGGRAGLKVGAVLQQLDTAQGRLTVQLTFLPNLALAGPDGLRSGVVVQVNDSMGNDTLTFFQGSVMQTRTAVIAVGGSRALRYPFDHYRAPLTIRANVSDSGTSIPVAVDLVAALPDFTVSATNERQEDSAVARLAMLIERQNGVVLWGVLFMVLCWMLAFAVAALSYLVLVRTDAVPLWLWGFITGILFALPNLRNSLPGDPPFGSAVDWGAFYWGVLIIALCLLAMVVAEGVDIRRRTRPDHPSGA